MASMSLVGVIVVMAMMMIVVVMIVPAVRAMHVRLGAPAHLIVVAMVRVIVRAVGVVMVVIMRAGVIVMIVTVFMTVHGS